MIGHIKQSPMKKLSLRIINEGLRFRSQLDQNKTDKEIAVRIGKLREICYFSDETKKGS